LGGFQPGQVDYGAGTGIVNADTDMENYQVALPISNPALDLHLSMGRIGRHLL